MASYLFSNTRCHASSSNSSTLQLVSELATSHLTLIVSRVRSPSAPAYSSKSQHCSSQLSSCSPITVSAAQQSEPSFLTLQFLTVTTKLSVSELNFVTLEFWWFSDDSGLIHWWQRAPNRYPSLQSPTQHFDLITIPTSPFSESTLNSAPYKTPTTPINPTWSTYLELTGVQFALHLRQLVILHHQLLAHILKFLFHIQIKF